jgi:pterin-4a-carbinolamine dehydratase
MALLSDEEVRLMLTNRAQGGLTEADFALAAQIDQLA